MTAASEWVRAIAGAALVCAAAMAVTPKGSVKGVLKLLCGVVLLLTVIKPLTKLDAGKLSLDMADYRTRASEIAGNAQETQNALDRRFIEQKFSAYILDKAKDLGLTDVTTEVTVKWGEGCWYPYAVSLTGQAPQREKRLLENAVEYDLGIPKERQYWNGNDETK
ncbi:MAG: hypothetical protein ACOX66_03160 [Oscillospiraceae bacterium]|jgi:hypothetical protein